MKILVTGGAGFIGSHLCEQLLKENHEVICLDAFYSGKKENIEHLLSNKNFSFLKWDVRKPFDKKIQQVDRIYHLACPASPLQYQFDPVLTLETALLGMSNVLKLARRLGARVLYTSTSEVYGDPLEHPQKESYWGNVDPLGQRACYDEGKRAAEALCKDYHNEFDVDVRIVRIFNTYGPRMMFNDGRVLSNFILQALSNQDITVHGDGMQTRSFCYVSDLVDGLIKRMEVKSKDWKPVNLGNPEERSIKDAAEKVIEFTKSKSSLTFIPYEKIPERMGDPKQRCPDISRAKELVGWEPLVPFAEGLEKTIDDFKKRMINKSRVLVFSTTYFPLVGPSEKAVQEITKRMNDFDFDIITAKMDKNLPDFEKIDNVSIYRLGKGKSSDKFFLPLRSFLFARKLHKKYHYQKSWAIMASYGAVSAAFFQFFSRKVPFLLSIYEGNLSDRILKKGKFFSPVFKWVLRKAARTQILGDMNEKEKFWLEDVRKVQAVNINDDFDNLTKKTREMFQDIEIISTRI